MGVLELINKLALLPKWCFVDPRRKERNKSVTCLWRKKGHRLQNLHKASDTKKKETACTAIDGLAQERSTITI